jgi:hypothetical protein
LIEDRNFAWQYAARQQGSIGFCYTSRPCTGKFFGCKSVELCRAESIEFALSGRRLNCRKIACESNCNCLWLCLAITRSRLIKQYSFRLLNSAPAEQERQETAPWSRRLAQSRTCALQKPPPGQCCDSQSRVCHSLGVVKVSSIDNGRYNEA